MKKIVTIVALLALMAGTGMAKKAEEAKKPADAKATVAAPAGLTADLKLAEQDNVLWCHVRIHGLVPGQVITPVIKWTAPKVVYVVQKGKDKGKEIQLFSDSEWQGKKELGEGNAKNPPCVCSDTGEKGCTRTKATRTLVTELSNGKTVRAVGVWKVDVQVDGKSIGSGEYEVK